MVDTLAVELDKSAIPLINDITTKAGIKDEDVAGLIIVDFRYRFLPANPFIARVFYVTQDDGFYHIDKEYTESFVDYLNFLYTVDGLQGVSLVGKKRCEAWI